MKYLYLALLSSLSVTVPLQAKEESPQTIQTAQTAQKASVQKSSVAAQVSSKGRKTAEKNTKTFTGGYVVNRQSVAKKKRPEKSLAKTQEKKVRQKSPAKALNIDGFSIYDAWTYLEYDYDGDGYHSEFTVTFDADYDYGYAEVYADMYLSRDGGEWVYFNTTDIFSIDGNNSGDSYSVTTALNYNFPTGDYDVLIDLYEAGVSGIVATASPEQFNSLAFLPLEDQAHELNSSDTLITYVESSLSFDQDNDGFYTEVRLEYDLDAANPGAKVFAEIELYNVDTYETTVLTTSVFTLDTQTEINDLILENGFHAGWYDIEIRIVDDYTGQVLAKAAQDFSALIELPVESEDYDYRYDDPLADDHVDVIIVEESGGGSLGLLFLASLGFLIGTSRQWKVKKIS